MTTRLLIIAYLAANVAANLIIAATPLEWRWLVAIGNAAAFIALDITSRDRLHDVWRGDRTKLAFLIGSGALLSAAVNLSAWPIALASCIAFAASGAVDSLAYHALRLRPWYARVNGSNIASAIVDSALFLSIAALFGVFPWFTVPAAFAGQVLAKVIGGAVWAFILAQRAHA
jgi:hypothetical protein